MLPMDYQYYISAWIYKVLKAADEDFARFLHDKGYGNDPGKLYKLFCFSKLYFGKPIMWKDKGLFEVSVRELSLKISFDVPEAASTFIKGLFLQQEIYLGDKFNGLDLVISKVESLAEPEFSETMQYKLETPWVVSYRPEGREQPRYLDPNESYFRELSVKHLVEKYKNTCNRDLSSGALEFLPDEKYKRAGFLIKNGTNSQTRVVGNIFSFSLKAPVDVHRMLWNAGISEKSSSGFGWVEIN
jgi:CRISPR-associated endoribonuclease Cas6